MNTNNFKNPIDRLVNVLSQLPGIGEKTATRLCLFLVRDTKGLVDDFMQALTFVKEKVHFCKVCQNFTEGELCEICFDTERNQSLICVVQEPVDQRMVEKTGEYRGLYHILHGVLSPLDGVGPEDIRISNLLKRIQHGGISEVILATNPNAEGETTALYLKKVLAPLGTKITRIASGVPVGGILEYTDVKTLSKAMDNRKDF